MAYEFRLPDIGEGVHEGEIVQWLVQPGDVVQEDQALVEVMTDKVTAEIPSPVSGVIRELRGKPGETVPVGAVLVLLDTDSSAAHPERTAESAAMQAVPSAEPRAAEAQVGDHQSTSRETAATAVAANGKKAQVLAAPATRKLARTLGVDLAQVKGSGPHGRITQADIRQLQTPQAAPQKTEMLPAISGAPIPTTAGDRRVPFGGMRRRIAAHLTESKRIAPHFAYVEEVDMSRLVAMREELVPAAEAEGVKLSYLPFIIKAVIAGLRRYPVLNAQLDETTQELVYKGDYHIGIAVATDQGLIVPVVRHADQKGLFALANEIQDLAQRARSGKLTLPELKGGTFTITSIGSIGGLFSVPIINHPEVAILGVNRIDKRPVVRTIDRQEQIVIREMMNLSISCDHRVVDGAEAARFMKEVIAVLECPARLLL